MKRIQIVLGTLLLSAAVIGFSSFSHKAFTTSSLFYTQHVNTQASLDNINNWASSGVSCSDISNIVCEITYDETQLSPQQAIDALQNATSFKDGDQFAGGLVTVITVKN